MPFQPITRDAIERRERAEMIFIAKIIGVVYAAVSAIVLGVLT